MTNLEWVNELAKLPGIVGIVSNSSPAGNNPVIEIYYNEPIDKEVITKKFPLTHQNKTIFKDLIKKNEMKASEFTHAKILFETKEAHVSKLLVEKHLREAAKIMEAAKDVAIRGDVHFTLVSFTKTVNSWNRVIYALNNQYLENQEGAAKKAARMQIKPSYYLVRLEQAYTYFASHNPILGFDEFNRLHNEIAQMVSKNY